MTKITSLLKILNKITTDLTVFFYFVIEVLFFDEFKSTDIVISVLWSG